MSEEMRPWYRRPLRVVGLIVGGLFLAGLIAFAMNVAYYRDLMKSGKFDPRTDLRKAQLQSSASSRFANTTVTKADLERIRPRGPAPSLGSPTATVQIVEFVDYGCPFCKQAAPIIREFMADHAADVHLVIRDFPITELHPDAENAAIAANCVFRILPSRYWDYYDRLFSSQGALAPEDLRLYAAQMKIDLSRYDACVNGKTPLMSIQQSVDDGLAAGVEGTPTFFFNGVKIQGAMDRQALEVIVEEARSRSSNL